MKRFLAFLCAASVWVCSPSPGQPPTPADNAPHNGSGPNQRGDAAEQPSKAKDDLALMQQIRRAVANDESLSRNAKTIQIIARQGKVKLRGAVETQPEKDSVASKAGRIAGPGNVELQLEVKTGQAIPLRSR
jgi:osmotically-inducible protein OsmY